MNVRGLTSGRLCSGPRRAGVAVAAVLAGLWAPTTAVGLWIEGFDPAVHDRFVAGFPLAPEVNADAAFVGLPYDLTGVGWSAADPTKGFGFVSPQHYLVATHYGGAATIRVVRGDGEVVEATQLAVIPTGLGFGLSGGDLSVGRLTAPLPGSTSLPRYAVLDLATTSSQDTLFAYAGRPLLVYGRGSSGTMSPRVVEAVIDSASSTRYGTPNTGTMLTKTTTFTLQVGDSGSPVFARWINPDGSPELTIIGTHAAVDVEGGNNIHNFLGRRDVIDALNGIMNGDGLALRVTGTVRGTWVGGSETSINSLAAWGLRPSAKPPSDAYVLFDAATAAGRTATIDTAHTLRGIFFRSTAAADDGFLISGTAPLTLGRGGITNYDADRQVIDAPLILGDHQYWDVGVGGVAIGPIATQGRLLEIAGSGSAVMNGPIHGSGSVSVSGPGIVRLEAANDYLGATRVFAGSLILGAEGRIDRSPLVLLEANSGFDVSSLDVYVVPPDQMLAGLGTVTGSVMFGAGSTLSPGRPAHGPIGIGAAVSVPEPSTSLQAIAGVGVLLVVIMVHGSLPCPVRR